MYRGYSLSQRKLVYGNLYEERTSLKNGQEKSFIITTKGKVQVLNNSISKNLFIDDFGYDVFSNDFVTVQNGPQFKKFFVYGFGDNYVFVDEQGRNYRREDLRKIFGNYFLEKIGNRFEKGGIASWVNTITVASITKSLANIQAKKNLQNTC